MYYVWSDVYRGRINGGGDINSLGLLPDKLKTELALHVNLETLRKVLPSHFSFFVDILRYVVIGLSPSLAYCAILALCPVMSLICIFACVCVFLRTSYWWYLCAEPRSPLPSLPIWPVLLAGRWLEFISHVTATVFQTTARFYDTFTSDFVERRSTVLWVLGRRRARSSRSVCCEGLFGDSRWEWEWVTE